MSWVKQHLGIDGVDLTIHVALTALAAQIASAMFSGFGWVSALIGYKVMGLSLLVFAWRRSRNLRGMRESENADHPGGQVDPDRVALLESRMADLEVVQGRVAELEERLDFAERLLAQGSGDRAVVPGAPPK